MTKVTIGCLMTVQKYLLGVGLAHTRKLYGECAPLSRNGTKPEKLGATGTRGVRACSTTVVHGLIVDDDVRLRKESRRSSPRSRAPGRGLTLRSDHAPLGERQAEVFMEQLAGCTNCRSAIQLHGLSANRKCGSFSLPDVSPV